MEGSLGNSQGDGETSPAETAGDFVNHVNLFLEAIQGQNVDRIEADLNKIFSTTAQIYFLSRSQSLSLDELVKLLVAVCTAFPDFRFEAISAPSANPDHSVSVHWVARGTSVSKPYSPMRGTEPVIKGGVSVMNSPELCTFFPTTSQTSPLRIHRMVVAPESGTVDAGNYGFTGLYAQLGGEFTSPDKRNVAIVVEAIHRLTSGDFNGPDGPALAAALTTPDCLVDADHPTRHCTLCRRYIGPKGVVELATELSELRLSSVTSTFNQVGDGRVFVELSYVPTVKSTGRQGTRMCDLLTWTIEEGHVAAVTVRWGNPAGLDALFGPIRSGPAEVFIGAPSTGGDPHWPLVFVSSYTKFGNLAHGPRGTEAKFSMSTYRLNPVEGSLTLLTINQGDPTMNPAFSRVNRKSNVLYACTESVEENGHIVSWRVDTDSGRLTRIGCADAQGTSTCYITLDRTQRNALVVNYWNATIVVLAINPETGAIEGPRSVYDPNEGREMSVKADAHVNHSVNDESAQKERQLDPHSHAVILDPYMGKIAYVPDLGMDVIRQLTFDEVSGTLKSAGTVKSGSPGRVALGPRYIEFHPTLPMAYVINELSSEVAVFQFDIDAARRVIDTKLEEPTLHLVQMISTLPVAFPGSLNTCGRITVHNSGRYVVVSNRGHDSIAVFSVLYESNPPGLLAVKTISHTRGSCPRHFAFDSSGMWLLAANQDSDSIAMFQFNISTGDVKYTGNSNVLPSPNFVCFMDPRLTSPASPLPPPG